MENTATLNTELSDDDLIAHTLKGDTTAFSQLMHKYKNSLYDLGCRILGNKQEAEDVLQDAFLDAYKHLKDFHHRSLFSTWLYSIVMNRIRNRLRRNKTIRWHSLDAGRTTDEDSSPVEMPEKGPSLQVLTENTLAMEALQKAILVLPMEYRTIFTLHYMQNLPLQEVAKRLNRPTGTVKVYLHRARKLLYQRLSSEFREEVGLAS